MIMLNKTITITGACMLNDGEKDVQVAYMNANIPVDGLINTSRSIQDKKMFEANREEVLKDFAAFDEYVYNCAPPEAGDTDGNGNKLTDE